METDENQPVKERHIWIRVTRIDFEHSNMVVHNTNSGSSNDLTNGDNSNGKAWKVKIQSNMNTEMLKTVLRALFHIHDHKLILRMRNEKGNLIPMNGMMANNTSDCPHVLEVVKIHQHNKQTAARTDFNERCRDLTTRKLDINLRRIEGLEKQLHDSESKYEDRTHVELDEIRKKVVFLHNRFELADSMSWKGMFKRNPFW